MNFKLLLEVIKANIFIFKVNEVWLVFYKFGLNSFIWEISPGLFYVLYIPKATLYLDFSILDFYEDDFTKRTVNCFRFYRCFLNKYIHKNNYLSIHVQCTELSIYKTIYIYIHIRIWLCIQYPSIHLSIFLSM